MAQKQIEEPRTTLQQWVDRLKDVRETLVQKVNSPAMSPLHAFVRQGADEIAQVLPAFPDSMRPQPEAGQLFEPTPQLITEQITGRHVDLDLDR